jgi:hypothetical protein
VTSLIFTTTSPALLGGLSASSLYVAGDKNGDFNYDRNQVNLQIINQALVFVVEHFGYKTVYLKFPSICIIDILF